MADIAQEQVAVAETSKAEAAKVAGEAKEQALAVAETTKTEASAVASGAKERALSLVDTTKSETAVVVAQAKEQVLDLVGDAKAQLRQQADTQTTNAAGALSDLAHQLSAMAEGAQAQDVDGVMVELARRAADGTSRWADRLESGGVDELVTDMKRLAQERPGLFLLGVAGAGFAIGRVAKSVDTHGVGEAAAGGARGE